MTSGAARSCCSAGSPSPYALQQIGYSWFAFYRARGESWPQAVESAAFGAAFAVLAIPGALLGGSWGFVAGRLGCTACLLAVRSVYVHRLLPGVRLFGIAARAAVPVLRGVGARAGRAARAVGRGADAGAGPGASSRCGSPALALATRRIEGGLLAELRGYLRPA